MSRSIDRDDIERARLQDCERPDSGSQARSGGSGSDASASVQRNTGSVGSGASSDRRSTAELAGLIDQAAAGRPTISEFVSRLEERGIAAIPSIQSSGRLNGMSYRFKGATIKGSALGREYTAHGLQKRKGVQYDSGRDDSSLRQALERAGFQRYEMAESRERAKSQTIPKSDARVRDRATGLTPDQTSTLAEIGRFRTLKVTDLVRHRYAGNSDQFRQDMRRLTESGLAERRTVFDLKSKRQFDVVVVTPKGRKQLQRIARQDPKSECRQQYYAGFVKPSEVHHDAGLYVMYQAEKARIEREGGTVNRVVLDFQLKREIFGKLNRERERSDPEYGVRKQEIAEEHGLKVVNGRIAFPDLRIEYQDRDGDKNKVDLELATAAYKSGQVRAKHAAGLKIYAPDSALGTAVLQDPEIVSGLISI
jgi:DNA-binding MarR family transcriptional regulator